MAKYGWMIYYERNHAASTKAETLGKQPGKEKRQILPNPLTRQSSRQLDIAVSTSHYISTPNAWCVLYVPRSGGTMSEGSNAEEVAPNRSNAQRERKPVIPFVHSSTEQEEIV